MLFASRRLCGRGTIWSDISVECPREVHVKGDYGNLSLFLRILFGHELRDDAIWVGFRRDKCDISGYSVLYLVDETVCMYDKIYFLVD